MKAVYQFFDNLGAKLENKQFRIPTDLATGVIFALFSVAVLLIMPSQVVVSEKDVINGRAFPTLVCYVMLACSLLLVVLDVVKLATHKPLQWKVINMKTEGKALILFGIIFMAYLLSRVTGLFVIGAVFACLGFLLYFRTKKTSYYVITIAIAVVVWVLFRFVLGVEF